MAAPEAIQLQRTRAAQAKVRSRRDVEGPTHRSILRYLRTTLPHGFVVQHTPNKPRNRQQGAREKTNGAIAGWPDLAIYGPGPNGPSAWFLEVKPPILPGEKRRKPSDDQEECHAALTLAGFSVRVARSVDDAREAVGAWGLPSLDMRVPDPTGGQL